MNFNKYSDSFITSVNLRSVCFPQSSNWTCVIHYNIIPPERKDVIFNIISMLAFAFLHRIKNIVSTLEG